MNIVLNIQSPGYYADSLNGKSQDSNLTVETPNFTLFLIYIHTFFFNFFFYLFFFLDIYMVTTAGALPHTKGENPKYVLLFLFTESLA